jgi:hypothetical protein
MPWDAPGSTAVVISVPEADALIGDLSSVHTPAGRDGMWPHVTLLVPFVPAGSIDEDVELRLRGALAAVEPFEYRLGRLERFSEEGVLYLAPEPEQPFLDLINELIAAFPDQPPYDGAHGTIVPHATVAVGDDGLLSRLASEVEAGLPIACATASATLVERGDDLRWRRRAELPLAR